MKHTILRALSCLAVLCLLGTGTFAIAEDAPGSRILVAYYSYTGNTEAIARQIAQLTGGDLARIERTTPYPQDNDAFQDQAEQEILHGETPEITVTLEDGQQLDSLEGYEEVYVGYPIWWDEAPAMITSFLEQFDFAGKAIAPFCTSAYSSIDNSLHIFGERCPDAVLMEGLTANDDGKLEEWVHAVHSGMTAAGKQVRLTAGEVEVIVTLNGSRAAASLVEMLPLELTLIERENFAKGMTLPDPLADTEKTTRDYEIGDFGYWAAGPDLAIFYDDIYEKTIVEVIPLGHADSGAEALRNCEGTVLLELVEE